MCRWRVAFTGAWPLILSPCSGMQGCVVSTCPQITCVSSLELLGSVLQNKQANKHINFTSTLKVKLVMTESALLAACREGKTEAVGRMLGSTHQRQVVTSPSRHTQTPRLDPNIVSAAGLSPLHLAVQVELTDSYSDSNLFLYLKLCTLGSFNLRRIQLLSPWTQK